MSRQGENGSAIFEVLVALAIAGPALAMLYRQAATATVMIQSSFAYQEALSRARSRLDTLTGPALVPGERSGEDGNGFLWRTRVIPVATEPPHFSQRADDNSPFQGGTALYALSATISLPATFRMRRGGQTVTLESRRLGPADRAAP